jgi:FtsJ-like methyltransferase
MQRLQSCCGGLKSVHVREQLGGRRTLSHMWKQRRDSDQYANMAIAEGLRTRAAYKLMDIDSRFDRFLRQGSYVVDLGAAPGGFALVAANRICLKTSRDQWNHPMRCPVDYSSRDLYRTIGGKQKRREFGAVRPISVYLLYTNSCNPETHAAN